MEKIKTIIIIILILVSGFLFYQNKTITSQVIIKDSIIVKTQTTFETPIVKKLYDKEITLPLVPPMRILTLDSIKTDTLYVEYINKDSIKVHIPIKEYTYKKDSLYDIKVSGYDVNLLSVSFYDKITTKYVESPSKVISFGPTIGYGWCLNQRGVTNGVIIGVSAKINITSLFGNGNLRNNRFNNK